MAECMCRIVPGAEIPTTASGTTIPSGGEHRRVQAGAHIVHCPLHAKAEAMEKALRGAIRLLDTLAATEGPADKGLALYGAEHLRAALPEAPDG